MIIYYTQYSFLFSLSYTLDQTPLINYHLVENQDKKVEKTKHMSCLIVNNVHNKQNTHKDNQEISKNYFSCSQKRGVQMSV